MKKRALLLIFACTLSFGALTGCSDKEEPSTSQTSEEADDTGAGTESSESSADDAASQTMEFEATTIDGGTITSDVFGESRLTMLNVWATYCNPCLNEMPELGELASEYDSSDFQLIGIISDVTDQAQADMTELAASLIEETGADYPHLLLNESLYYAFLYDVTAVPTTFFFNEDGELLDTVVGAMDKDSWKEKIDGLLEEM